VFGTGGFQKNINVVVGGNATGYISAMTLATSANKAFRNATVLAGAALAAFSVVMLTKAVGAAADFEHAMAGVKAVTQAVPKDFDRLIDKAKELGRVTKFTMMDIAAGMEALGKAGFTTNEILFSMAGVADLAAAGGISLGEAADITSKAIRALGLDASDSTRIADVFAQAAARANVDVLMLGESMKYIAPLSRAAGYSLEGTTAIIAKLGDIGIQSSMAGTSVRFAFSELLAETDGFKEALSELGMTMDDITGPDGKLMGFVEILGILEEAGADTGDIITMMGKRAGPAIAGLLANVPGLREFTAELENAAGAAKTMADIRLDTLRGQLEVLRGSWELMLVTIGEKVTPIIQEFVEDSLIPAVNEFAAWAEASDALEVKLRRFFDSIISGFQWLLDNWKTVVLGIKAIEAALISLVAVKIITGLVGLGAAIAGMGAAATAAGVAVGAGAGAAGLALGSLLTLLAAAGIGLGVFLAKIKMSIAETKEYNEKAKELEASLAAVAGSWNESAEAAKLMGGAVNIAKTEIVDYLAEQYSIYEQGERIWASENARWNALRALLKENAKTADEVTERIELLKEELISSGAAADDMAYMFAQGLAKILADFGIMESGVFGILDRIQQKSLETAQVIANSLSGLSISGLDRLGTTGLGSFTGPTPLDTGLSFTGVPGPEFLPSWGGVLGGPPAITAPGAIDDAIAAAVIAPWRKAMDELRDMMADTPTQATAALMSFMSEYGHLPTAFLAGKSAARSLRGDLTELEGAFDVGADIETLNSMLDKTQAEITETTRAWATALEELRESITEDPTKATDALVSFMDEYGNIPTAFLAGKSAARGLIGDLESLSGAFDVSADIETLEGILTSVIDSVGGDVSELQKALDGVDFDNPIQALNELLAIGEQVISPTELAMVGASLSSLESFVSRIASLPDELRPDDWETVVARFEALRAKADQAVQGFLSPKDLQEAWANLKEIGTPLDEMVGLFTEFAGELSNQPDLLREIYSLMQNELSSQKELLAIQTAFGFATEDTTAAVEYLEAALGLARDAAQTLAQSMQAQTVAQAGTVVDKIGELIGRLSGGNGEEEPLTIGGIAEMMSEISGSVQVISTLRESMYDLGLGATETGAQLEALYQELSAFTSGLNPEEVAAELQRASDLAMRDQEEANNEAKRNADQAASDAKRLADEAGRQALDAAKRAAEAVRDVFLAKFSDPISTALASGDWIGAADAVTAMAQSFPALTAEAEEVSKTLEAVGMKQIDQMDVLKEVTGMERDLVSALQSRIELAELAEDFDMAEALGEILKNLFAGAEKTWKEKTVEWLDKGWAGVIDSAIGMLPGKLGEFASGIFDVFKKALTDPLGAISSALGVLQMVIQMFFEGILSRLQNELDALKEQEAALKEQEAELLDAMSFYVSTLQKIGSLMNSIFGKLGTIGQIANATITAFISSIEMLTLTGFDLLRAGVEMLTNFIGSLINAISGLIEKSDAYKAVQSEGARAWKAISDLFGQFLWPLAALLKHILDWLGIQTESNAAAEKAVEIGVPSIFKRAARAYESAAPGEIFTPEVVGGGVEIPSWATEIVEGIAGAIEGVLKKFGIDSWADLLEKFKAGSIRFWGYVENNIPKLVSALTSIFTTLSSAFGGGIVDTIVDWLRRGFDWFVNEGPGMVEKAVWFIGEVFGLAKSVLAWIQNNLKWEEIKALITSKFAEFKTFLGTILSLTDLLAQIGLVQGSISDVALAIDRVENQIEKMKTAMVYAMAIAAGAIIGGIAGAISAANPWLFGAPAVAAIIGAGVGALSAGFLAAIIARLTPGFAEGGMVPGPIGSPQLALVHGGESVLTRAQQQGSGAVIHNHISVFVGDDEIGARVVERIQHGGKSITGKYATAAGLTRRY